jgi:hypothetical protein
MSREKPFSATTLELNADCPIENPTTGELNTNRMSDYPTCGGAMVAWMRKKHDEWMYDHGVRMVDCMQREDGLFIYFGVDECGVRNPQWFPEQIHGYPVLVEYMDEIRASVVFSFLVTVVRFHRTTVLLKKLKQH